MTLIVIQIRLESIAVVESEALRSLQKFSNAPLESLRDIVRLAQV